MGTSTDILRSLRGLPALGNSSILEAQDETPGTNGKVNGSNGHNYLVGSLVSPPKTIPYQGSGGESERREYADGEGLAIEAHDSGYVLLWSSQIQAPDFLRVVGRIVDASATLEYGVKQRRKSLSRALKMVLNRPAVDAIQVDAGDETFRWSAHDPYARERRDLTLVTMAFSVLDSEQVTGLITETATPNITGDLSGIIASVGHLTHAHLITSSAAA